MPRSIKLENYILPIGMAIFGYFVLKSLGFIPAPTSSEVTAECPRGNCYSRGFFETCAENYISRGNLWNDICDCIDARPPCPGAPSGIDTNFAFAGLTPLTQPFRILNF